MNQQPKQEYTVNWNDVRRDYANNKINERLFTDIRGEEVHRDLGKVARIMDGFERKVDVGIKDSDLHEYSILKGIDDLDWFEELERGRIEAPITALLTSDYDDTLNHIDLLCFPRNKRTGKIIPFALDATYTTGEDARSLDKIDWQSHGKTNLSGVTRAKYCMVKGFNGQKDQRARTPILMPRFVVGFDNSLTESIIKATASTKIPSSNYYMLQNGADVTQDEVAMNTLKAKWCFLKELEKQSSDLIEYLEPKQNDNPETLKMYKTAKFLSNYFNEAIEVASEYDPKEAQDYPADDPVYQNIMSLRYTK